MGTRGTRVGAAPAIGTTDMATVGIMVVRLRMLAPLVGGLEISVITAIGRSESRRFQPGPSFCRREASAPIGGWVVVANRSVGEQAVAQL